MKILFIDVNCKNSSTGKIVYDLYTAINESGHEAAVCYGRGEKIKESNIFKFGIDAETYIHALLTRVVGYTGCYSPFSTFRLIRFIKKFKPDVVHIHELHAYFVNIKPLINYLKKNKIKTVMTLHCEFAYTGKCGHSVECEKWKTECGNCPHLHDYPSTLFFDHTKSMFRKKKKLFEGFEDLTVITPSGWFGDRASQSFLKAYEIKVVHNGVNTEIFRHRETKDDFDGKIIFHPTAFFSDLADDLKGGRFLIELAKRFVGENVKFVVAGTNQIEGELPDNIVLLGKITDQNELASWYSRADLTVMVSKKETFGMAVAESLCSGTPIVGFKAGGPESVAIPEFSEFVDYADLDALENIIRQKWLNFKEGIKISNIVEEAQKNYSLETFFDKHLKIYGLNVSVKDL